jgi:hypothetical protein
MAAACRSRKILLPCSYRRETALFVLLASVGVPRMAGDASTAAQQRHTVSEQQVHQAQVLGGVVSVTLPPYNADPTGVHDATDAINQALQDGRNNGNVSTVLLPLGVSVAALQTRVVLLATVSLHVWLWSFVSGVMSVLYRALLECAPRLLERFWLCQYCQCRRCVFCIAKVHMCLTVPSMVRHSTIVHTPQSQQHRCAGAALLPSTHRHHTATTTTTTTHSLNTTHPP